MADYSKYDMTDIWASTGDVVAPDSAKIAAGWGVEVVPRQWWNWFENRQDNNIAYILQKGIPEWDATTQYQANKSFVQQSGIVYKALTTGVNKEPSANPTDWARAFGDYSIAGSALSAVTPAANMLPYFTGTSTASTTSLTPFARTILDDADAAAVRTTLSAQTLNSNLTALSGVTAAVNGLPYFTSTTAMGSTSLTAFARTLLDDADANAARSTLDVYSINEVNNTVGQALTTVQPLDATLTALAGLSTGANQLPYSTGTDTFSQTPLTAFARTLLDDADAATARTTLGVLSSTAVQPIDATLTALATLTTAADTLPYFTGVDAMSTTPLTTFARSLLDDVDSATARATLGAQTLDATLTALAALVTSADSMIYATGVDTFSQTSLTSYARSLLAASTASAARTVLGLGTSATLDVSMGTTVNSVAQRDGSGALFATAFTGDGSAITNLNVSNASTGVLPVARGGSGVGTSTGSGNLVLSASPALTGVPTAPTAAPGDNSTQLATTAFVLANSAASPTGAVADFAMNVAPTGWLKANGSTVSRTTYASLFSKLVKSSTATVTIASPGVWTWTGHTLLAQDPVVFTTTGALPTGIVANTTYYVIGTSITTNTFQLSATPGGAAIATTGTQSGVHTAWNAPFGLGDGSTTFGIPDLRAEFIRGWDDGRGVDGNRSFGSSQLDSIQEHAHSLSAGTTLQQYNLAGGQGGGGSFTAALATSIAGPNSYGTSTVRVSLETRARNVALLRCIKY